MKKYLVIIMIAMFPLAGLACDICGCGAGNGYLGILPDFYKHILGLRYRYNSLTTHLGAGGVNTYLTTKEYYHTAELWGGWNIGKKFRAMLSVPYSFNERNNQGISKNKNGISDITVSGYYRLLQKKQVLSGKLLVQSLWVGGGIKLPTGEYNPSDKASTSTNANLFQLGTGSVDFNLSGMYDIRLQDIGMNLAASYKINTANKYDYKYGNKLTMNAQAYYKIRIKKKVLLAPNFGVQYESAEADRDKGFTVTVAGGRLLLGTAGIETVYKKVAVGANFQTALSQNLAHGIVKANDRCMVHVSFTL